jgi:polysaccharide export outer membrane protein
MTRISRSVMISRSSKTGRLAALLVAILLCGALYAQTVARNSTGASALAGPTSTHEADIAAAKPHDNSFVIGNDDVLAINVWKEPDISRSIPVRSDGKISLPLVGELQAAGLTPLRLESDIAGRLKNYISEPEVTVIVQQVNSQKFNGRRLSRLRQEEIRLRSAPGLEWGVPRSVQL